MDIHVGYKYLTMKTDILKTQTKTKTCNGVDITKKIIAKVVSRIVVTDSAYFVRYWLWSYFRITPEMPQKSKSAYYKAQYSFD